MIVADAFAAAMAFRLMIDEVKMFSADIQTHLFTFVLDELNSSVEQLMDQYGSVV